MLPTVSMARTWNVWLPGERPLYAFGLVQVANAAPSSLHWNVPLFVEVNEKDAVVTLVEGGGWRVMLVFGGVRSIVQVKLAGVASVFPAGSVARTWKVWLP